MRGRRGVRGSEKRLGGEPPAAYNHQEKRYPEASRRTTAPPSAALPGTAPLAVSLVARQAAMPPAAPSLAQPDGPPAARASILAVDDQPANLLALEALLADLGHPLVKVVSGEDALRWLLDNDPAVILMDVRMPGLDGYETARLIRGRDRSRHTPIIFVTAHET